ncbi:hypothetical protein OG389_03140 [Streptomyces sp. NBC_00435]|uniref:hypothetical protein n=1 Tax=Streptomyces sp. NBC_00435 TaxID=2903649 RepID=UPI002E1BA32C
MAGLGGFSTPLGVAIGTRTVGDTPTGLTLKAERDMKAEGPAGTTAHPGPGLRVRLASAGEPLEGKGIVFSSHSDALCMKPTDGGGRVTCPMPNRRTVKACYTATFLGDRTYAPATATVCTKKGRGTTRSRQY